MSTPDRPTSPVSRTAGLSAEHRAALIAHLAERLAGVPVESDAGQQSPSAAGSRGVGRRSTDDPAEGDTTGRSTPPGRRGVIGAGGDRRAGRGRRPDGGHPEDAPGDPETVAKQICLRQLTGAAKPRAVLADVLRRRGIPDDVAASVLDRFTEVGLIDDEAYAAAYVSTKQRDRSLGAGALRVELRRKGLDDEVVSAAVAVIDEAGERERAVDLVARRIDAAMQRGAVAARRRLVGLLARRGYPSGLAHAVVSDAVAAYMAEMPSADEDAADFDEPGFADPPVRSSSPDETDALSENAGTTPAWGGGRWPRRVPRSS